MRHVEHVSADGLHARLDRETTWRTRMTRGWTKAGLEGTCLRRDKRDEAGGRAGLAELHMRHVEHVSADGLHARRACTRTG